MEALLGLMCFLLAMAVVLALVAVVGHGLWLMGAAIFGRKGRRDDGYRDTSRRRLFRTCVGCGEEFFRDAERCPECGLDPESDAAGELKDLRAAERAARHMVETGALSAEACVQVEAGVARRREALLSRRRARIEEAPPLTPVQQLEAWLGSDVDAELSVPQKQQALALARNLAPAMLRELSAPALIGIARLQASVGLLSRAAQVYRIAFDVHPHAPITRRAAAEAIQVAVKLGDWHGAEELVRDVANVPGLVERDPELAALIEQVRTREPETPVPVVMPAAMERAPEPVVALPASVARVEEAAPVDVPVVTSAPPRRSLAEWIAVFMEERNIMWGELIGGSLIVGCSIALVITYWREIGEKPYSPFLIFAGITCALLSVGLYTLHHWKLESTSRGLLLIGTLLVPLDFLVLAGLPPSEDLPWLGAVINLLSFGVFGWLLFRSSHILVEAPLEVPASALLVALAMLASGGMQLIAPAWLANADWQRSGWYGVSLLPALAQLGALGWILLRLRGEESWSVGRLVGLLIALGSVTFACSVTLGFALSRADVLADALVSMSPAITLVGVPMLLAGILAFQRITGEGGESRGLWRTVGTGIALAGVFVMFGGFAGAIDDPLHRWLTGGMNLATLLAVAWALRVPALHVPAQVYLASLVVFIGGFAPLDVIDDPSAALKLTGLLAVQALLAEILARRHRPVDARCYAIGAAVSTALAILLALRFAETHPGAAGIVLGAASLIWLAANVRWRISEITYACSLALAAAFFFASRYALDASFGEQLLWGLLAHATVCLLASAAMRRAAAITWLQDAFRVPLQFASLFATFAVVGVLAIERVNGTLPWTVSACACGWLAALWLAIAALEESPALFGAFQIALGFTWFFGAAAFLTQHGWDWAEPHSLQIYALGLGILGLGWEMARVFAQGPERVRALIAPEFPPVDRWITASLVIAQYVLTLSVVFWSLGRELGGPDEGRIFPVAWHEHAFSIWAWFALAPLAGIVGLRLRQRDLPVPLIGCTLLVLTLPLLAAGTWFDADRAGASATRWGLVIGYGLTSFLLWNRQRLGEWAERVPVLAIRAMFVAGAVVPALWMTAIVAVRDFAGNPVPGPEAGIFVTMGGPASLLIPLFALCAILAGHGFRERLAYYLSAAASLLIVTNVGAYFLGLRRMGRADEDWVGPGALVLAAASAWLASIVWTWIASLLEPRERRPLLDSVLLTLNGVVGSLFFGLLMLSALLWMVFDGGPERRIWAQVAGSPWNWLAFGVLAFGAGFVPWKRRASLSLHLLGILSLTAVGVAACSVEAVFADRGFVALMFLSGLYACAWVTSNLFLAPAAEAGNEARLRWLTFDPHLWESVLYASIAMAATVFLGSFSLFNGGREGVWSAESVVLAALACGLLAYQRKQELWTSLASLWAVLACTILAVHFSRGDPDGWVHLLHLDLAVLAAMALARLALHRWLSPAYVEIAHLRQLPAQIGVGLAGLAVMLFFALLAIAFEPAHPGHWLRLQGSVTSWLALTTGAAATLWYVGAALPRAMVHAVGVVGLMLGIVLAGSAEAWPGGEWIAHHVLTLSWTLLALVMLIVSWLGTRDTLGPRSWPAEDRTYWAALLRHWFPEGASRVWVSLCGAAVVLLALRAASVAPERPWWSVADTLAVSVLLGALAIWARAPGYLFGSGLLFNVVGALLYAAWVHPRIDLTMEERIGYFLLAQVLSFAAAAVVWSLLERWLRGEQIEFARALTPFTQFATFAGILLLAGDVVFANLTQLLDHEMRVDALLAWSSLGALLAAVAADLWRPFATRFTRLQLYVCGLSALGLALHQMALPGKDWLWTATLLLAGYVLLIVVIAWGLHASARVRAFLDLPAEPAADGRWLWDVQIATIALVACLAIWISLSFATLPGRLGGAGAVSMLALASCLLVQLWPRVYRAEETSVFGIRQQALPYYLTLKLGFLIALTACWALIDLQAPALWLQRSAALLGVAGLATLAGRFALPRLWSETPWGAPGRRLSAALGVFCLFLLLALLGQELLAYNPAQDVRRTPLLLEWVLLAGAAIAGLVASSLVAALTKETDTYGIEGANRSAYVYLAELLTVAFLAHVRLNLPDLIHPVVGQYWFITVMVLAFVGIALSDYFARKEMPVLSTPLKRSALAVAFLPVLAFRIAPLRDWFNPIRDVIPGIDPFLRYLQRLAELRLMGVDALPMESLCWLLLGIFLGWLARSRRSANYGIAAALAINCGVWVLLGHQDATTFLQRPQLWLIPLGLIILVAEFVNREQLGFWPSLSVRYLGLVCIYLSSTFEMFKDGLGNPILAISLALLAVVGMLLGILFRVRAFLLAGFTALLLVIFAQIWHAAVHQAHTWVWWASGILLGVIILVMFAIFEKRRNDVLRMIDNMKQWH